MRIYKVSFEFNHPSIEGWTTEQEEYYSSVDGILEDCQDLTTDQQMMIALFSQTLPNELSIEYRHGQRLRISQITVKP